jgi:hypothetical protein
MRRVGFEPTIPMFEQSKTVRALDRAARQFLLYIVPTLVKQTDGLVV